MKYKYPAYSYPISDLIDRLSICILKKIHLGNNYSDEIINIKKDMNYLINNKRIKFTADILYSIMIIMLTNYCIWLNESKARSGGSEQDKLLKFTHSINGQRNTAKNFISFQIGDRIDLKIDCLAAEFKSEEFKKEKGDWQLF